MKTDFDSPASRFLKSRTQIQDLAGKKRQKTEATTPSTKSCDEPSSLPKKKRAKKQARKISEESSEEEDPGPISLMLAKSYEEGKHKAKGWLMSEKLDGVRCFWNGTKMYSRGGKPFYPPKFFKESLPKDISLDGELWTQRNDFQKTVSIVRRQDKNPEWENITYMVYDAPLLDTKFSSRLKSIDKKLKKQPSKYVKLHQHVVCKGSDHLKKYLNQVLSQKGEGIMIKDPSSKYESKRSGKLLKVKEFHDTEATIIGYEEGTGKYEGLMGAIKVRSDEGLEFKIGSGFDDEQRKDPPKIGSRVTYKHQGLTDAGKPRFPIFVREHPGL